MSGCQLESALRSIAAPIRSRSGVVVAAVNVSIPWSPVPIAELVSQFGPILQTTADQVGADIFFGGHGIVVLLDLQLVGVDGDVAALQWAAIRFIPSGPLASASGWQQA